MKPPPLPPPLPPRLPPPLPTPSPPPRMPLVPPPLPGAPVVVRRRSWLKRIARLVASALRRLRRRRSVPISANRFDPERTLIHWTDRDGWTIRDSFAHVLITGETGSGKSSGSGDWISDAFLATGYGGLVLTVKRDEVAAWRSRCRRAGRSADLICFGPGHGHRFNFLEHEAQRSAETGGGITKNIETLLTQSLEVAYRGGGGNSGGGHGAENPYFDKAKDQVIRNGIDLLRLAGRPLSVFDLYRIVASAPTSTAQLLSESWQRDSFCFACLKEADQRYKAGGERGHDLRLVTDFFTVEWPELAPETRSCVGSTFTSVIDVLNRSPFYDLFSTTTTLTPAAIEEGKIILLDMPLKTWGMAGLIAQSIFKSAFQQSIERRAVNADTRPVFQWIDEAQFFLQKSDALFATTCRSARVSCVMLTQSIQGIYECFGGKGAGEAAGDQLLGNLATKIFHANSCRVTNEWASELIGRVPTFMVNASAGSSEEVDLAGELLGLRRSRSTSAGVSETMELEVPPNFFSRHLRNGGPVNQCCVDGIVFRSGRLFARGRSRPLDDARPWHLVTFTQKSN